jgi:hypothetical protein
VSAVKASVFQRNPTRFDMAGQRLTTTLTETAQTISPGLVQRLRHYAAGVLEEAGFDVGSWACEVYTLDADESPSRRVYTVEYVNPKGGMLGVKGIHTERGWPSLDHGLCVASDHPIPE